MNFIKLTSVAGTVYIVNVDNIAYVRPYHDNTRATIYFKAVETNDDWMHDGLTLDEKSSERLLRYLGTETIL